LSTTAATTTSLLTKDVAKNIAESFTKTTEAFSATTWAAHVGINTGVTVLVVGGTFLCVRQHLVGLFDLFEFSLSVFGVVSLMAVRVELHGQFAIRFFNLFFRGVLGYTQYFVKVSLLLFEQERRASDFLVEYANAAAGAIAHDKKV
jgi:hypothetical protein